MIFVLSIAKTDIAYDGLIHVSTHASKLSEHSCVHPSVFIALMLKIIFAFSYYHTNSTSQLLQKYHD